MILSRWGVQWGGYLDQQALNLHLNFSSVSFTWKKIEPKGKGPCPRRRQCCCIVGDKIVLFGGTRSGGEKGGLQEGPEPLGVR